ncbi:RecE-like recombination exonuclease [Ralstonia phage Raharianne]|uniref:Uncharacterized protein n=2 Tax=Rahariannevirus raharianne TaxID=2846050 RepID=A0A7G5BBG2_9CAUD|nr:RecE-like recombination exonuclease [Ralstonia phage Raharianne]QMV32441.1 hypothetical protein U2_00066 [Ralstonia phage Albius]QMV33635.1 hypothetical protein Y2_00066 [Ralstonia phage Raharianne]
MKIVNALQGTPEWAEHRQTALNASDAPVMMGISPYRTRSALLHERATGIVDAEISPAVMRIFAEGHRTEVLARPLAEKIIGEELYPMVGTDGCYSASFDGLTLLEDIAFEHKMLNDDLRAVFDDIDSVAPEYRSTQAGRLLPDHYRAQMEQQCMVSGCERVLFMASNWAEDGMLIEERHCWYFPDQVMRERIIAGWHQFALDLANYVPQAVEVKPLGRTPETLPALLVEVTGRVTASNLREYRDHALTVFAGINRELSSDQDFADAEKTVKWCGMVEERLAAAKQHALSQTASIDELFRTIDDISAEARRVRLDLDKLVTRRKVEVKEAIIKSGRDEYYKHVEALKEETGGLWVDNGMPDFANVVKGKRSLASIQDAVDTLLANAKIAADAVAKDVRAKLAVYQEYAEHNFLFSDLQQLIKKPIDDFRLTLTTRIDTHVREQQERANRAAQEAAAQAQAETPTQESLPLAASPAPSVTPLPGKPRVDQQRPTDAEIIGVIALRFRVHESKALEWLLGMDLKAASEHLAAAF